ncbi:hypothetical protein BsWGS_03564 [Bradybaena similaris]
MFGIFLRYQRMIDKRQGRAAVMGCLIVIVVLVILNLNSIQTFAIMESLVPMKNFGITKMVARDREPAFNKELQNLRQKGLSASLEGVDLSRMSEEELLLTAHSYLDNAVVICRRKLRMGNMGDGGWEICDDPDVRPRPPCIIYSFGINYDFSFDDDASNVYGCHVYSFDPSMKKFEDHVERSKLVHFYKIGLSDSSTTTQDKWKMKTLADIRTMLGHDNVTIDVIKMDIEWSEWPAIPEMIRSGQLKSVRQLMVEYHLVGTSRRYMLPRLQTIQAVERAGFKKYYVHKNPACVTRISGFPVARTMCYEVHYVNF